MPPLGKLPRANLTALNRGALLLLRVYLVLAVTLVVVRAVQISVHAG
jgi:hypothetical protein